MKRNLIFIFLLFNTLLFAGFKDVFTTDVLRIDYFRMGDARHASISLYEIYRETPWAGSHKHLIDSLYYGEYRIEVKTHEDSSLIFSMGYSSLFREWQTTDEAREKVRAFPESVRIPYPREAIIVQFLTRDKGGHWIEEFRLFIDPADPYIVDRTMNTLSFDFIHESGKPERCLDLLILAEGYTLNQADLFREEARRFAGYLLNARPFDVFKDHINIRAVFSPSTDETTDIPAEGIWKNTALHSRFYTFESERYLTTSAYHHVMDMASGVPWDQVLILVNTDRYGGGGIYNFYSICSSRHPLSDFVFIHEFGHSFAGLGDEYYSSDVAYEGFYDLDEEPWEPNLTTLQDFDSKWKDMVLENTPIPTPATYQYRSLVGVFEGGGYRAKGIFRPAYDCTMKSAKYDHFCPVCQRSIQRMLELHLE